ncbi:MAG TPA: ATP-binding protein [Candidatus Eisenbacteria bacterium]|jgi:anti-sigma regulatory factor (Ser/Thr protein kinase)|nr:ATP-binding protein [Candidatus Eisenbacteria bacterium]
MRDTAHQITELKLPAREEYIVVAKRAAGALGAVVGFSLAEIDDLNIAITQACENAVAAATDQWGEGNGQLKLTFKGQRGKLEVNISSTPPRAVELQQTPAVRSVRRLPREEALDYEGIGLNMIRLFVDELRYQVDDQGCMRMRMVKYLID